MQPITRHELKSTLEDGAVQRALERHDGDAYAVIAGLLADCGHLREQLALASRMMGHGYSRGWVPDPDRLPNPPPDDGTYETADVTGRRDGG